MEVTGREQPGFTTEVFADSHIQVAENFKFFFSLEAGLASCPSCVSLSQWHWLQEHPRQLWTQPRQDPQCPQEVGTSRERLSTSCIPGDTCSSQQASPMLGMAEEPSPSCSPLSLETIPHTEETLSVYLQNLG